MEGKLYQKKYIIDQAKASLFIIHGLHEHCERYSTLAQTFNMYGIDVYTFDLKGHGRSSGEPHFVQSIQEYVNDVDLVINEIPKHKPLLILGHSMGGLIAVAYLLDKGQQNFSGLVLSGAALKPGKDITPLKASLVKIIAKFFPRMKTVPVKPHLVSRDKVEVQKYIDDPNIALYGAKAGLGVALLNAIAEVKDRYNEIQLPTLVMHGMEDLITDPEGSRMFYDAIKSKDKTLKIWESCYHEIFNEINKDEVIRYTADWIVSKVS
ncbi:MAG TPA: alpha/beta hydrolase [Saprospiraceae bacterium]|nr:alpha/beta hydrolase [Saprospiraceae bacterium]